MRGRLLAMAAIMALAAPCGAAIYVANLGPMPLDDETKAVIAGRGEASASLTGRRLTVQGTFGGLPSPATRASLFLSPAIGVPGSHIVDLQFSGAADGTLAASVTLTETQVRALRTGRIYVEIDSEKAPPGYGWGPKGTLWGWLFPALETAEPGVAQQGHWFIPQNDTPSR
jgi:hypothetical protein